MSREYENAFDHELSKIKKDLDILKKRKAKMRVLCSHCHKNGKLALEPVSKEKGMYECVKCGEVFHLDLLSIEELNSAFAIFHDSLNQIKCLADTDDTDTIDKAIIQTIGELHYNLKESIDIYQRLVLTSGSKKKKKKRQRDEEPSGSYGYGSLSSFGNRRSPKY